MNRDFLIVGTVLVLVVIGIFIAVGITLTNNDCELPSVLIGEKNSEQIINELNSQGIEDDSKSPTIEEEINSLRINSFVKQFCN
ncbi:hypothetical protein LCGC14_1271830 [marine sediment metagenome]|uniref:Uncharacterized protein n=1 Tax=marine sediment metagenome TaxID=412755 RepID=A0A0F9P0U6_9ZZZZ